MIKLLDSAETPTAVYIVVERVRPLGRALEEMSAKPEQRAEWVGWGLSKIAVSPEEALSSSQAFLCPSRLKSQVQTLLFTGRCQVPQF